MEGRSVWELNEESSDSWGWKNIIRMRHEVRKHMIVKLGNGTNTSMWFDSWSPMGALNEFVTYRDLYDARFKVSMTVSEFVVDRTGQWPEEWHHKFLMITQMQPIILDSDRRDSLEWKRNDVWF
ncbi:reverse transcriptase domain, Reverse transcriptase zinc-binding domain protein [Artemisia annua]|uniref:Reverse transcriptase domain, Reverse transcriptase zinc-binding domain protein n=1 Tax=Artemisia annua TaxID=35608 RepID=A0A2U1KLM5_ARTAN|nr:reverse transcriptase domain, Reverse transcriptase zinc-binding domain protein [Artemisia annua]